MRWSILLLCVGLLVVSGCGTTEPSDTSSAPASPTSEPLTEATLQTALLTLDDLPAGWEWELYTEDLASREAAATAAAGYDYVCDGRATSREPLPEPEVATEFAFDGPQVGRVFHRIWLMPTEDDAREEMESFRTTSVCTSSITFGDEAGKVMTVTVSETRASPMPFPSLGDESAAHSGSLAASPDEVASYHGVLIREGPILTSIGIILGSEEDLLGDEIDPALTEALARLAEAKLRALGQ